MSKWIDRMATFDPKDSMREDKVAFYFTQAGLLQCSVDGITTLTIPFTGASVITGTTRSITGADNGTTLFVNNPTAAVTFTLPAASVKMKVTFVNLAGANALAHILDPTAPDTIKGNGTVGTGILGANVDMMKSTAKLPFQTVVLQSDGVLTWAALGSGAAPALLADELADEEEKNRGRLITRKKPDEDDEPIIRKDEDDKKKKDDDDDKGKPHSSRTTKDK